MKEIIINKNEAGQRLDKLLAKHLKEAPKSFLYKMMRKKNITLNGRKATGNELTVQGDVVRLFFSDETYEKFSGTAKATARQKVDVRVDPLPKEWIIYEDDHILVINKPSGILSQKSRPEDISVNEQMIAYLLQKGDITKKELQTFHPSVCNRLDRNTSGLLIAGKSLVGLQTMAQILQNRSLHKYYLAVVHGVLKEKQHLEGYLSKDPMKNCVQIYADEQSAKKADSQAKAISTEYTPLQNGKRTTLLEILLLTGRSHQIRAHLASTGHSIVGDVKYGGTKKNGYYRKEYDAEHQLLHAFRMEFPQIVGELSYLSGKCLTAPVPELFEKIIREN